MTYTPGIDVSHWQGSVDWQAVKAEGKLFAFIKATDGDSYVDSSFADNWKNARAGGILRSAYHFFRPQKDAEAQADLFLRTVETLKEDLPPTLDLEVSDNLKTATIIQRVEVWMQAVEAQTGRKAVIYSSPSFLNDHFTVLGKPPSWAKDHILWIANYLAPTATQPNMPKGWATWNFWQHSASGRVNGIQGNVDLNWFNGSVEELFALVEKPTPTPAALTYTVKPGDTLAGIADELQLTLEELVKANPQLLQPGMELNIPSSSGAGNEPPPTGGGSGESGSSGSVSSTTYVVQAGDTLGAIAARFKTTVAALVKANNITNPNVIQVGQNLIIP